MENITKAARRVLSVQSYEQRPQIPGVEVYGRHRFVDDGGAFCELARCGPSGNHKWFAGFCVRQVNYSEIDPGAIKAFHLHQLQTDIWFVPPSSKLLVVLVDVREGMPQLVNRLVLGVGRMDLLRIPPRVAHGCKNLGATPGQIFYFVDREFDPAPDKCDEGRLPWDFVGREVWEVARG